MTLAGLADFRKTLSWYRLRAEVAFLDIWDRIRARPVTGNCDVAVSLTTYGVRLNTVHTTIQSIVAGSVRPKRLILWLDGDPTSQKITPQLKRLQSRGLEIRYVENFGPHKKYFPYVRQFAGEGVPLVTADDDVIYAREWLAGLMNAHISAPELIHCNVARQVSLLNGKIGPYLTWRHVNSSAPSIKHFAIGFAGVIYPPKFLLILRDAGDAFMKICPRADDVWLHAMAIRSGHRVRQISENPDHPRAVPYTQEVALFNTNQLSSGNDVQIQATYTSSDLAILMEKA